jgi:hypothetical protein
MTFCEASTEEAGGQTGRDAFLAAVADGGGDWQLLTDCWLSDERRIWCICPADVFCSNTARALNVRLEITACASCMHKNTRSKLIYSYVYDAAADRRTINFSTSITDSNFEQYLKLFRI